MSRTILTVTLNPSLEVTYPVAQIEWNSSNPIRDVRYRAGGRGIGVGRMLRRLGCDVIATGFLGGRTGDAIHLLLVEERISENFIPIAGTSRQTVLIEEQSTGRTAELAEPGPVVTVADWDRFRDSFASLVADVGSVVLSGSLPPGCPSDAYAQLSSTAQSRGVAVILDASGDALLRGLAGRPSVVKPNNDDLFRAADRPPSGGVGDVIYAAQYLMTRGAQRVAVTVGPHALIGLDHSGCWQASSPGGDGVTASAGDAIVAALARGTSEQRPWHEALRDASAFSAATSARGSATAGHDTDAYTRLLEATTLTSVPIDVSLPQPDKV